MGKATFSTRLGGDRVLDFVIANIPVSEARPANARLIAAAPELLEALKLAQMQIENPDNLSLDEWIACRKKIRAAIAKATGSAL